MGCDIVIITSIKERPHPNRPAGRSLQMQLLACASCKTFWRHPNLYISSITGFRYAAFDKRGVFVSGDAVLSCPALCCTVLYCAVLCYTVLYFSVLCWALLRSAVLYCTVLSGKSFRQIVFHHAMCRKMEICRKQIILEVCDFVQASGILWILKRLNAFPLHFHCIVRISSPTKGMSKFAECRFCLIRSLKKTKTCLFRRHCIFLNTPADP